jgi:hypothetical protein
MQPERSKTFIWIFVSLAVAAPVPDKPGIRRMKAIAPMKFISPTCRLYAHMQR